MATVRSRDGCVVPTEPLAGLLHHFVDGWNRERPTASQANARARHGQISMVSALEWIAQESGVGASTIQNLLPQESTGRPRYQHTELWIADAVVQAIGRTDAFYDGCPPTLEILPNPCAKKEAQAACCSGSLTGAVRP